MPVCIGSQLKILISFLVLGLAASALAGDGPSPLVLRSEMVWSEKARWFGGISGVEVSSGGQRMTAITDRGHVIEAVLKREGSLLTRIEIDHEVALHNPAGKRLSKPFIDSEGLAIGPDGSVYVSFEGQHRLATVNVGTGITTPVPNSPDFEFLNENSGLEALAITSDGTLFTLPEQSDADFFPLFSYGDAGWSLAARIPKKGPFLPVGADFGPDGLFYMLERTITLLGFRSQIRRFDLSKPELGEQLLLQTLPSRFDNLEAISVWQDAQGKTFITLIADDNFIPIQRTQVVEFEVIQQ